MKTVYNSDNKRDMKTNEMKQPDMESYFTDFSARMLQRVQSLPASTFVSTENQFPQFDTNDQFVGFSSSSESTKRSFPFLFQRIASMAALFIIAFFIAFQQFHPYTKVANENEEMLNQIAVSDLESSFYLNENTLTNDADTHAEWINELMDPINDIQPNTGL